MIQDGGQAPVHSPDTASSSRSLAGPVLPPPNDVPAEGFSERSTPHPASTASHPVPAVFEDRQPSQSTHLQPPTANSNQGDDGTGPPVSHPSRIYGPTRSMCFVWMPRRPLFARKGAASTGFPQPPMAQKTVSFGSTQSSSTPPTTQPEPAMGQGPHGLPPLQLPPSALEGGTPLPLTQGSPAPPSSS